MHAGPGSSWAESGGPVDLLPAAVALEEDYNAAHPDDEYLAHYFQHSWAADGALLELKANFCGQNTGKCLMPTTHRLWRSAGTFRVLADGEAVPDQRQHGDARRGRRRGGNAAIDESVPTVRRMHASKNLSNHAATKSRACCCM